MPSAKAALLYSETADIWRGTIGTPGAAKRSLCECATVLLLRLSVAFPVWCPMALSAGVATADIALRHAQLAVDVVIEEDLVAGHLNHYGLLLPPRVHLCLALPCINSLRFVVAIRWACVDSTATVSGALYVVDPQVSEVAMAAASAWVAAGGQLVLTAGGGMLNETNQTSQAVSTLLPGLKQTGLWTGIRCLQCTRSHAEGSWLLFQSRCVVY